jgi:ribonuclease-3
MKSLGIEFRDPALLELALTHASTHARADNERLEFLGDAVLDLIVTQQLFEHPRQLAEGAMTEIKAAVVSRRALARAASELELESAARFGAGLQSRAAPVSVLANLYEAVLGAIYVDVGFEAARAFVLRTLGEALTRAERDLEHANPKQNLQHWTQSRWGGLPTYEVLDTRGSAHARAFLVRARFGASVFPSAWGRTLKEAERWAAREAMLVIEERARLPAAGEDARESDA